ncbi:MAG: response regulator [Pseudomonadota bacterium]
MKTPTILVEDNETIRETLIPTMVELADVEVIDIAETADGAIELLKTQDVVWKLAIVDLMLKKGTGLDVVRSCRSRRPDQHVLVLTNYPTDYIRRHCIVLGADAVFGLDPFS